MGITKQKRRVGKLGKIITAVKTLQKLGVEIAELRVDKKLYEEIDPGPRAIQGLTTIVGVPIVCGKEETCDVGRKNRELIVKKLDQMLHSTCDNTVLEALKLINDPCNGSYYKMLLGI